MKENFSGNHGFNCQHLCGSTEKKIKFDIYCSRCNFQFEPNIRDTTQTRALNLNFALSLAQKQISHLLVYRNQFPSGLSISIVHIIIASRCELIPEFKQMCQDFRFWMHICNIKLLFFWSQLLLSRHIKPSKITKLDLPHVIMFVEYL